jgi:hypothetical protein
LWVRAVSEQDAFDRWIEFYQLDDFFCPEDQDLDQPFPPITRAQCEGFFDCGFSIERKKTYREPVTVEAGAIEWDDARRLMVEGL